MFSCPGLNHTNITIQDRFFLLSYDKLQQFVTKFVSLMGIKTHLISHKNTKHLMIFLQKPSQTLKWKSGIWISYLRWESFSKTGINPQQKHYLGAIASLQFDCDWNWARYPDSMGKNNGPRFLNVQDLKCSTLPEMSAHYFFTLQLLVANIRM